MSEWQAKHPSQGPVHSEGSAIALNFFQCRELQGNSQEGVEKLSKRRSSELGPKREVRLQLYVASARSLSRVHPSKTWR